MSERIEAVRLAVVEVAAATRERRYRLKERASKLITSLEFAGQSFPKGTWLTAIAPGPPLTTEEMLALVYCAGQLARLTVPDRPGVCGSHGSKHKAERTAKREQKRAARQAERRAGKAYVISEGTRVALEKIAGDCAHEILSDQDFRRQLREEAREAARGIAESLRAARERA